MKKKVAFYLCEKDKFPNLRTLNYHLKAVFNGESVPVMLEVDLDPNLDHLVIAFCSETVDEIQVKFICEGKIEDDGFFWMSSIDMGINDSFHVLTYDID